MSLIEENFQAWEDVHCAINFIKIRPMAIILNEEDWSQDLSLEGEGAGYSSGHVAGYGEGLGYSYGLSYSYGVGDESMGGGLGDGEAPGSGGYYT